MEKRRVQYSEIVLLFNNKRDNLRRIPYVFYVTKTCTRFSNIRPKDRNLQDSFTLVHHWSFPVHMKMTQWCTGNDPNNLKNSRYGETTYTKKREQNKPKNGKTSLISVELFRGTWRCQKKASSFLLEF